MDSLPVFGSDVTLTQPRRKGQVASDQTYLLAFSNEEKNITTVSEMDSALIAERDAFKKRAMAQFSVEKRKAKTDDSLLPAKKPKPDKAWSLPKSASAATFDYKKASPSTPSHKFGILANIVKYMKTRHLAGDTHTLTLEEILDETKQLDLNRTTKVWLEAEALRSNPKIEVDQEGKFGFKAPYKLANKKSLLRLLEQHDRQGLGGVMLDDVMESLHNAEKLIKKLGDQITIVTRLSDKKKVMFYNDKSSQLDEVDEELQKLWNSTKVEGVDERKIEEHLLKHGMTSMADAGLKKVEIRKKPRQRKRGAVKSKDNEHLNHVLQDYSDMKK